MTGRNSTKKVGFSLPEETVEEMRKTSRKTGISQSRIVTDLLDKCLPFFTEEGLQLPQIQAGIPVEEMVVAAPEADERIPADMVPDPTAILKERNQPGKMIREAPVQTNSRSHLYQTEPTDLAPVQRVPARQAPVQQPWQQYRQPVQQPVEQQFIPAGGGPGYTGAPVQYNPGYTGPPIQQPVQAPPPQQMGQTAQALPADQMPSQQVLVQPRPAHMRDPYSLEYIPGVAPIPGGSQAPTTQSLLTGGVNTGQSIMSQNPNMQAARAALGPNWRARLRQQQAADRRDR